MVITQNEYQNRLQRMYSRASSFQVGQALDNSFDKFYRATLGRFL